MSRTHGSALDVCFLLRCPCLGSCVHLALSCSMNGLQLQLRACQGLQSVLTPLPRPEDSAGVPVSFPEGITGCRADRGASSVYLFAPLSEFCLWSLS